MKVKLFIVLFSLISFCYAKHNLNQLTESGLTSIMQYYNQQNGLWHNNQCIKQTSCTNYNGYWYFANIYKLLVSHESLTGDKKYHKYIMENMQKSKKEYAFGLFFDDELWWTLAFIDAYKLTHEHKFLKLAKDVMNDVDKRASQHVCGGKGGIYWNAKKTQVGSVANQLYILANSKLYQITHEERYIKKANDTWKWYQKSGLLTKDYIVYDHYTISNKKCGELIQWHFTYTDALLVSVLANLALINEDKAQMNLAMRLALKSMHQFSNNGVLTETCGSVQDCAEDGFMFKGVYVHELSDMAILSHDRKFMLEVRNYLINNYNILIKNQGVSAKYAFLWDLPLNQERSNQHYNPYDLVTITSAVYLFNSITKIDNALKSMH